MWGTAASAAGVAEPIKLTWMQGESGSLSKASSSWSMCKEEDANKEEQELDRYESEQLGNEKITARFWDWWGWLFS